MSKVYVLRVNDPEDSWIADVYSTKELAYEEAMKDGKRNAKAFNLHLVEAESDDERILFAEKDDFMFYNCDYCEYIIEEFEVKEAETDG